jgi:type III secretion protein Q
MNDATQLMKLSTGKRKALAFAQETPRPALRIKPLVKLSRAHLSLQSRSEAVAQMNAAAQSIAAAASQYAEVKLTCEAKLLDGMIHAVTHLSRHSAFAIFELTQMQSLAVLEFEPSLLGALLHKIAGSSPSQVSLSKLTRIEEAALGWLFLSLLKTARTHACLESHFAPRLVSIHLDRGEVLHRVGIKEKFLAVGLTLSVDGQKSAARLLTAAAAVQAAFERTPQSKAPSALAESVLAASFETSLRLGRAALTQDDVASLVVGDVVLFEGARKSAAGVSGVALLKNRQFSLFGTLSAEGFTLTPEPPMSHAEAQLEVSVELCRLKLSIQQLAEIQAGRVVPLFVNGATPVVLRLGDRAVAKAELVDIEGELGARIIALAGDGR